MLVSNNNAIIRKGDQQHLSEERYRMSLNILNSYVDTTDGTYLRNNTCINIWDLTTISNW